jgi:hypothetical protein
MEQTVGAVGEEMVTFEQFMASMQDLRKSQEATDRQLEENARQIKASQEKFDREMREFNKRFGDMVEYMVLPKLLINFEELSFTFTKANRTGIKDREHNIFLEVDALLENGDKVMAVEIKTKPNTQDIADHVERMEKFAYTPICTMASGHTLEP